MPSPLSPVSCVWCLQASAYPGFGKKMVLDGQDHITVCKPASPDTPGYEAVAEMLHRALRLARAQHGQRKP